MSDGSPRKSIQSTISVDLDDIDEDLVNERCCFGYLNLFTSLALLAVANFLVDVAGAALAAGTDLVYFFGVVAVGSLFCVGAIITSVREEEKRTVNMTQVWLAFKLLIFVLAAATLALENATELQLTGISISPVDEMWPLLTLLPIFVLGLGAQFYAGSRVVRLIALRDEIYIIPSPQGSVHMRDSLRWQLERRKSTARAAESGLAKF